MRLLAFAGALLLLIAGASTARATVATLNAQVHDQYGNLVTGTHDVTIRIYSTSTGGTPIWSETHTSVTFTNGNFTLQVGSLSTGGIPSSYFDDNHWAGVVVSGIGLSELDPRVQLARDETTWTGFW